ncbi:MAG: hypothetical protein AB1726_01310 [Planctomycetota bacterium]
MMTTAQQLLLLVAIPLFLGAGLLRAIGIGYRTDRLAWLGWCWVAGSLGTGAIVFAWMLLEPDFADVHGVQLLLAALGAMLLFAGRARIPLIPPAPDGPAAPRAERILFAAVVGFVVLLCAERSLVASLAPVHENDEAFFWALKAKALFLRGGFGPAYGELIRDPNFAYNLDYPPLNPFLQTWVFAQAGEVTHFANRLPFQFFLLALVLILAGGLRRVVRPAFAAVLLLLLASMEGMRTFALRAEGDLMVAVGALTTLDAWWRWRRTGVPSWLGLAALGATLMVWSKHEGFFLCCAVLGAGAAGAIGQPGRIRSVLRPRRRALWLLPPLTALASIWILNAGYDAANNFLANRRTAHSLPTLVFTQFPRHIGEVVRFFVARILLLPAHSNLALPGFFFLLLAFPRRLWRSDLRGPAIALILALVGYVLIFVGLPLNIPKILRLSAGRVVFHIVPAALLWLAYATALLFPPASGKAPKPG